MRDNAPPHFLAFW